MILEAFMLLLTGIHSQFIAEYGNIVLFHTCHTFVVDFLEFLIMYRTYIYSLQHLQMSS